MRRWLAALIAAVACVASGQANSVRLEGSTVLINDVPVMQVRSGSAKSRTRLAIEALSVQGVKANARAVNRGKQALLLLNDKSIFRIEPQDAAAARMSAIGLAKTWASNINRALTLPPLVLGSNSVQIGNGKEAKVAFSGRLAGQATVESSDESIVKVRKTPGYLVFTGALAGQTQVSIAAGSQLFTVNVRVIPMAAMFPQYASVRVTGVPATNCVVRGAVETAIWNDLKLSPSADIKFTIPEVSQIPPGEERIVPVRIKATAPEALPNEGMLYVTIRNTPQIVDPESELWYDNVPESIERVGQLFGGRLKRKQPIRILYHHDNDSPMGLMFQTQVVNNSDRPAQILIIPGDSPTDKSPALAGVIAADRFFRNWLTSSGEVVTIPPKGSLPIALRRVAPKDTVSGLTYIALLDGGPESVLVRSDAKPTFVAEGRWAAALASDFPWRIVGPQPIRGDDSVSGKLSDHVYPQPFRNLEVSYSVGGRHGFVRIGQEPIANATGDRFLDGNFGVIYTIRAKVDNPTNVAADVELVFEASAGYAGALFAVNGQVLPAPMLKPKGESRVLKMRLEPGASRKFTIQTIPHSGGSYPATLAIRTIDATLPLQAVVKKR